MDAKDKRGRTALHYAVENMAADAVEALLVAGATATESLLTVARAKAQKFADLSEDSEDSEDSEEERKPLVTGNFYITQSLARRLDLEITDVDWTQIPNLDDHEFQATVFTPPTSRVPGTRMALAITCVTDDDDDQEEEDDEEEEKRLLEAVVDAELIDLQADSENQVGMLLRCCLCATSETIFDQRPDLLLVKGRELFLRLSPSALEAAPGLRET